MMQISLPQLSTYLLAGLGLTLAAATAQAQNMRIVPGATAPASRYPAASLGLNLGYGAPYGWGLDVSVMARPNLDFNAGLGFTLTGGKFGVGTRYYFTPERRVSAFVGGNLVYSTGLNHVTITTSSTSNNYGGYSS